MVFTRFSKVNVSKDRSIANLIHFRVFEMIHTSVSAFRMGRCNALYQLTAYYFAQKGKRLCNQILVVQLKGFPNKDESNLGLWGLTRAKKQKI